LSLREDPVLPIVDAIDALARRAVDDAPTEDTFTRSISVKAVMQAANHAPELTEDDDRRRAIEHLRRAFMARLEGIALDAPGGIERAVVALELMVSLNEARPSLERDFPGLTAQQRAVGERLGLRPGQIKRVRNHLVFERYGDLGSFRREANLHRAFFRLVTGDTTELGERAARLYRTMLEALHGYVDYFLWFHLRARDTELGRGGFRALLEQNDADAVGAALHELLADDAAYARMLADDNLLHSGRMKLLIGRYDVLGMDHLRRFLRTYDVARWVDLAGGISTFYLGNLLGIGKRPSIGVDAILPDPSCLEHMLPLAIEPPGVVRLLRDEEIAEYQARITSGPILRRAANILRLDELLAAAPPIEGRTLYTSGGSYLGSIRPEDEALRKEALRRGLSGARIGAMQMSESILRVLRRGDLLTFVGRSGVPYLRGVLWLTLQVTNTWHLSVRAIGYRRGYPGRDESWDFR
jgi:hypothetical protein